MIQKPDQLAFSNLGSFLPGKVESLLTQDRSPEQYRNPCLTQAMVTLKLIDTVGSGIRRMFVEQRKRLFPLPDYLIEPQRVEVRITGRNVDERYAEVLVQFPDLSLMDAFLLDKVQKRLPISAEETKALRARKLIEGRTPNIHVSAKMAQVMGEQARHTLNKGLEPAYYRELVLRHLHNFKTCKREELEDVLLAKLPDVLSHVQKRTRVKNLLADLSRRHLIEPERKGPGALWRLVQK